MSYRGRPSKGCEGCRNRKVKCDEMKPVCSRCSRSGIECKYRDHTDFLFKNQTAAAAQRAEDSWRKRSKSQSHASASGSVQGDGSSSSKSPPTRSTAQGLRGKARLENHASQITIENSANTLNISNKSPVEPGSIPAGLDPDLQDRAYQRLIYDFVVEETPHKVPGEPSDAMYAFVPRLYSKCSPNSCLKTVVDAISYLNYSNRSKSTQLALMAEETIGKAIKKLYKVIADKTRASSNETLCSVLLMTIYENLTIRPLDIFIAHQHGANALLQLRSLEQFHSNPISTKLYEVLYNQMLLSCLQSGRPPPIPVDDVVKIRQHIPAISIEPTTFMMGFAWKEAVFHARWHEVKQSTDPPTNSYELQDLLQSGLDLEAEYQSWKAAMPPIWTYHKQPNLPENQLNFDTKWVKLVLRTTGGPEDIHTYANLKRCWVWNFFRTSRIFLLRDTLEILNWMLRLPEPETMVSHMDTDSTLSGAEPSSPPDNVHSASAHAIALRRQHAISTMSMIELVEETCSSMLCSFMTPVPGRSNVMDQGVRGYITFWSLATMDSILSSGLVPDTKPPAPLSETSHSSPPAELNTPGSITLSPEAGQGIFIDAETATKADKYARSRQVFRATPDYPSPNTPISSGSSHSRKSTTPIFDPLATKGHISDSGPKHPYDHPVHLSLQETGMAEQRSIDVAARRTWLNRMLYYIGSELGIKKAWAIPYLEGYLDTVKPEVDAILGR